MNLLVILVILKLLVITIFKYTGSFGYIFLDESLFLPKGSLDPQSARVLTLTARVNWTEPTCSSWFGSMSLLAFNGFFKQIEIPVVLATCFRPPWPVSR